MPHLPGGLTAALTNATLGSGTESHGSSRIAPLRGWLKDDNTADSSGPADVIRRP